MADRGSSSALLRNDNQKSQPPLKPALFSPAISGGHLRINDQIIPLR